MDSQEETKESVSLELSQLVNRLSASNDELDKLEQTEEAEIKLKKSISSHESEKISMFKRRFGKSFE